ncbi:MAG: GntR family transcriptional regulator [Steroidobacteraceae bacterium]
MTKNNKRSSPAAVARDDSPQRDRRKSAERLAERIEADIIAADLRPGHLLGSISELLGRYDAGRAALREAVRLLERHGTASMKPGLGGGVIVKSSNAASARLIAVYLEAFRTALEEVFAALAVVETLSIRLALARADLAAVLTTNECIHWRGDGEPPFEWRMGVTVKHSRAVAELSGNRVLTVFMDALQQVLLERLPLPPTAEQFEKILSANIAHRRALAQALAAANEAEAIARVWSWYHLTLPQLFSAVLQTGMHRPPGYLSPQGLSVEMDLGQVVSGRPMTIADAVAR